MKKIIRNILSLILVVSILTLPVTSFADDITLGEYDNPYLLSTTSTHFTVVVGAESEAWVKVDDCIGSTLNVLKATTADYMIMYCRQPHTPETTSGNNTLSMEMVNGADMFNIYNPGTTSVELQLELIGGTGVVEQGTVDNPELVTMSSNMFGGIGASMTKDLAAGNEGYYYKTVAPADGIITVSVGAYDADYNNIGWMYFVNNDTKGVYGDTHWSDEEEPVFYEEVSVSKDDVVIVFAATYNPSNQWNNPVGTVSVDFSFSAVGTNGNPEVISVGDYAPKLEASSQGYYYKWTATEEGSVTVAMSDDNINGWQYGVNVEKADGTFKYGDTHWCDDDPVVLSESHDVVAGDILTIYVNTYNPSSEFNTPAGTVNWTLSFTAGEGGNDDGGDNGNEGGNEDDNGGEVVPPPAEETYTNSEIPLEVGTKEYPLIEGYDYTVFPFEPSQTGKYTFTAANGLIGIVSYNGMWVTVEPTADTVKDNSFVWECTGVGQTIWVAAKYNPVTRALDDGKSVSISISREDIEVDTMPWTTYINTHKPQPFTFTGDADELEPVEVFDNNVDKPVMGSDGYYHLNSATGPILYVDIDDAMMNLVDAMSYGQVKDIIMDGDKIVSKIDYNEAIGQYIDCADETLCLYPLTDDLIAIYKGTGHFQGWYGEEGWLGTTADDGYLFACYFINDGSVNTGNNNNNGGNKVPTGGQSFGGNNGSTGKPVGSGNSFGSGTSVGKPVTGTQVGKPVTGAAQTFDPFIINLAVLSMSGLGVIVTSRKKR
ncbi:MAG: hypothetical protein IJB57_08310 [Clostridia bacterium]|nr:hypothetical protein [Clostridia bacterium]